ncbi:MULTISPECIES: XTP/dITP diphosphatase [unclassified Bacillus (in: firmicutes)]|uniref:XTP/dITP diphosphatase n=1 Tax=unclassified Bacillus (in: firmicutes) TaxID=185979 RepID=UPI0008ED1E10|nr:MULTISPECIES: XTP/dITP diphosphatase [unclassified Bacillus (in: firmicutes)]SFB16653.1 XTP/dITP diphosphohydrolase [Bacillus sp. UNCCL13]SFQ77912.1 XTP/dITP diphosphohydrolase [Bacillus sp. cl95]
MKEVIIATKNIGKAKEFEAIFAPYDIKVLTLLDFPEIEDVEETGATFEENAIIKAESIALKLDKMVIGDDSGLIIDALDGRPGIYSARYAGLQKNDEDNIDKVLQELAHVPAQQRQARFYCALAVSAPNEESFTVSGTCEGEILFKRRGTNGFGYDPIFFVKEKGKAMAELTKEEKNQISHRANALKKLASKMQTLLGEAN